MYYQYSAAVAVRALCSYQWSHDQQATSLPCFNQEMASEVNFLFEWLNTL